MVFDADMTLRIHQQQLRVKREVYYSNIAYTWYRGMEYISTLLGKHYEVYLITTTVPPSVSSGIQRLKAIVTQKLQFCHLLKFFQT